MIKHVLFCLSFLAALGSAGALFAAEDGSYESFYNSSAEFRKADERLKAVYKDVFDSLDWASRIPLQFEQNYWRKTHFKKLALARKGKENAEAIASGIVGERIENLLKLKNSRPSGKILGLNIAFGMSAKEVAQNLGISDPAILNARPGNEDASYKTRLFGAEVPLYFRFMPTSFVDAEGNSKNTFKNFASYVEKRFDPLPVKAASNEIRLATLIALTTGEMDNRADYEKLNVALGKKYKEAWPTAYNINATLDKVFGIRFDKDAYIDSCSQKVYEDRQRYIYLHGDWGTVSGGFSVSYISRPFLDLHIYDFASALMGFFYLDPVADALVCLPSGADMLQVIYALGGRALTYMEAAGDYYSLNADFRENDNYLGSFAVYMTPENRAFAITFSYMGDAVPKGWIESIAVHLAEKYGKLEDSPDDVVKFLGHANNFDLDFSTADNYIHVGDTPHFAVQHEFSVINKKGLAAYMKAYEAERAEKEEAEAQRQEEIREDLEKF